MEELIMSNREADRLKVIWNALGKKLSWKEAGRQLNLSIRQVGYICARVRKEGNRGVIHRLRGKPSNNRLAERVVEKALKLIKEHYGDYMPTFASETLETEHGIKISVSSLRKAMIGCGLYQPRKRKPKHRQWRERRSCFGELTQLDGSEHDWFEGRAPKCVLLIFIDDATSRILYGEFVPGETTLNLLSALEKYLKLNGRPICLYVDRDSIYKTNRQTTIEEQLRDQTPLTQFSRALKELDIDIINAYSPQAKGRVERSFRTHQDRLIKELRRRGISDLKRANRFLWDVYIPRHNAKFAVPPANPLNAHRPLLKSHKLEQILAIKTERTILNDYTVRYKNRFFQITPSQSVRVKPKAVVIVEERLDGSLWLSFREVYLNYKPLPVRQAGLPEIGIKPDKSLQKIPSYENTRWKSDFTKRNPYPVKYIDAIT